MAKRPQIPISAGQKASQSLTLPSSRISSFFFLATQSADRKETDAILLSLSVVCHFIVIFAKFLSLHVYEFVAIVRS